MSNKNNISDLDSSANAGASPTDEIRNDSSAGAIDQIFYNLFETKAHRNRKHKTQRFFGIVLDRDEITSSDCILETSEAFYSKIDKDYLPTPIAAIRDSEQLKAILEQPGGIVEYSKAVASNLAVYFGLRDESILESGEKIYKIKVYIPEIMGFLPMLSKEEVKKYQSFKKSGRKLNKKEKALRENFRERLSRITSFYGKGDNLPPILQKVEVEFSDMNNMFFGKYIGTV